MGRNRFFYIVLVIALIVFSAAYKSQIASVLLVAALCYPLLALVCVLISSRLADMGFVDCSEADEQSKKGSPVKNSARIVRQKGEPFDLWIYVRSKSILPCAPVELICNLPDRETGFFTAKRIYASVPPLGRCRISVPAMHRYRGAYIAEISRASFFDPFRIIRISRKLSSEATIIFQPRKLDFGELIANAPGEDSSTPLSLYKGERGDFSHVREYLEGDIIQLVHWKLTAKQDKLMIKQYDETTERRAMILCNYQFDGADNGSLMKQSDAVIEAAVAVAMSAVRSGVDVHTEFGDINGEYRSEIRDMTDFDRFYNLMAIIPSRLEVMEFRQLIYENFRGGELSGGYSVIFLITSRLTEELVAAVENVAENFRGMVVLVNVSPGTDPHLEEKAAQRSFEYLPVLEKSVV